MSARKSHEKNISDEKRLAKNKRIKESVIATRNRRASMQVKVFDLKIVENKLSKTQKEALTRIFLEYKWIRNYAVAQKRFDLASIKELHGVVPVKTPDGVVERKITWLGSQMQYDVIKTLQSNLKTLSTLKKKVKKVGKLGFVSEWNSIDLQQFGVTYNLYKDGKGRYTKAKIQNIPGRIRVRGFEQLDHEGIEFANAKVVKKPDGYHLHVTTFLPPESHSQPSKKLGVDFGVKTQFTLSDGSKHTVIVEEPERLRRLQRKLSRQQKNSNGYNRTRALVQREYLRVGYRKDEQARQLVHRWTQDCCVYFQDENLSSWKKKASTSHGSKKIHHGIMGRVKTLLRRSENTVMLPSYVATTAWCPSCGQRNPQTLDKRVYQCSCGYAADRDFHAARNMILLGERYQQYTCGTQGSAGGGNVSLEKLYEPVKQFPVKPETAKSLVSP